MHIELEPWGGLVVRWDSGWTLLVDPLAVWLCYEGRILWKVPVGQA